MMRQGPTNSTPDSRSKPTPPSGVAARAGIRLLDCGDDATTPIDSPASRSAGAADTAPGKPNTLGEQRQSV